MAQLVKIIVSLSVSGSLLMLFILAVSRLTCRKFSKSWHYYIWLVVIIRLLLPIAPSQSLIGNTSDQLIDQLSGIQSNNPEQQSAPIILGDNVIIGSNVRLGNDNSFFVFMGWSLLVVALWLAIAIALFLRKVTIYQSFFKYIKASWQPVEDPQVLNQLNDACVRLGVTKLIEVYTNPLISSPMLIGVRRPYIVLPHLNISSEDLYYIFLHEVAHDVKKDIFYKWTIQFTICFHWFNPLVYLLEKRTTALCELSCDEYVARHLSADDIKKYGSALIAMLDTESRYKERIASLTLHENTRDIKKRLEALINYQKDSTVITVISCFVVIAVILLGYYLGI